MRKAYIIGSVITVAIITSMTFWLWSLVYYSEDNAGGRVVRKVAVQPIAYNHNLHVEKNKLECAFCHRYVMTTPRATIPNIDVCGACHRPESPLTNPISAEEKKVLEYIKEGKKIPWVKVYVLPDFVYFSHQRHVTIGSLDCSDCHGHVTKMTKPLNKQTIEIKMDRCINCHREKKVPHDCVNCHS